MANVFWEAGVRIVDIYGVCNDGSPNAKAGFSVFWSFDDDRNRSGAVPGSQTTYRAILTALRVALSTARADGHQELIIRSNDNSLHQMFVRSQIGANAMWRRQFQMGQKQRELMMAINAEFRHFRNVTHRLVLKKADIRGQTEAERMARLYSGVFRGSVTIYGIATARDGIARCGIFWKEGDARNESGWLSGKHGEKCAEMYALGRAVQKAIEKGIRELTVYSNWEQLVRFVKALKYYDWQTPTGCLSRCMERCKELEMKLQQITVVMKDGKRGNIPEARKLAESVAGCVIVGTFGACDAGNNEPAARYGVFWGPNDRMNEIRQVDGTQSARKAKLMAIRRALEIALTHKMSKLLIKNDYEWKDGRDEELISEIRDLQNKFECVKYVKHCPEEFYSVLEKF
ncbi:unnamed protein product [Caenorhabditis sp. 36 PRJEB53466]|nr:unnamed protein product [Caenorhabditis sp. 36 PRJEB53466]